VCPFCILLVCLGAPFTLFNNILFITYQKKVVDLFACWWIGSSTRSAIVWKMMDLCLLWCLWQERNFFFISIYGRRGMIGCFEDCKRSLEELKSFFLNTLYLWTAIYVSLLVISFHDFLVLFVTST